MAFFISICFTIAYKMSVSEKFTGILLKGCSLVVGPSQKQDLKWAARVITYSPLV